MGKIILMLTFVSLIFAKNHIVDQKNKTFIPHELKVKVGDTITFKNSDPFAHNAYTDDEANEFDIGMQKPEQDLSVKVKLLVNLKLSVQYIQICYLK